MSPDRQRPHPADLPDPAIAQELRHLEAALAGSASADPGLLALVGAVRADAPPLRPAFRHDLDARAAAGFPPAGGPRAWATALRARRGALRLAPALGLAATVLLALAVGTAVLTGGSPGSPSLPAGPIARQEAAPPGAGASGPATSFAPAATDAAKARPAAPSLALRSPGVTPPPPLNPGGPRRVQASTELSLRTIARRLQAVADGIVRVTQAAGGVVQQSNVDATDQGGTAAFTLSVPSSRAPDTVRRLSRLAHVASTSQAATDVTGQFDAAAGRLADARAERRALRKALDAARTPQGIARLRARLTANRGLIAARARELGALRAQTSSTTVSVTLTARGGPAGARHGDAGGGWSPRDAARDALRVLEVSAGLLLVAAAVGLPLGLVVVPALFGARVVRRRRREHALDAT